MDKYEEAERRYRARISLIESQIETALTLLKLAKTEISLGRLERIEELISKARVAQHDAAHSLREVNAPLEPVLQRKQEDLAEALSDVERRLRR